MEKLDRLNQTIQGTINEIRKQDYETKDKRKADRERAKSINEAPPYEAIDIYCTKCKQDYKAIGSKVIQGQKSWYEAKCPKGHRSYRNIVDKHLDPYYYESKEFIKEAKQLFDL